MPTTFEQAREIVRSAYEPHWKPEMGELVTLPIGYEDEIHWWVVVGAREALVDGDNDFQMFDLPVSLVKKETGELELVPFLDGDLDKLDAMTPTGG
jgi:hypothetical protein